MEKTKTYLNSKWLKEAPELWSDFVTDLVQFDCSQPTYWYKGEDTGQTCDLEVFDCYFDEQGNLHIPTVYNRTYDEYFTDTEGRVSHETEEVPLEYEVFKTKVELETEFEEYKKDHA